MTQQTCPYQKPSYLTEDQKKNCYATNRGWVILYPNGKYDVIESIAGLDSKISNWENQTGQNSPVNDIPEPLQLAMKKHDKSILERQLEITKREIKEVEKKIAKITKKEAKELSETVSAVATKKGEQNAE